MPIPTPVGPLPTTNSHLNLLPPASVIRLSSGLHNSIQKQLQTKRGEGEKKKKEKKRGFGGIEEKKIVWKKEGSSLSFLLPSFPRPSPSSSLLPSYISLSLVQSMDPVLINVGLRQNS